MKSQSAEEARTVPPESDQPPEKAAVAPSVSDWSAPALTTSDDDAATLTVMALSVLAPDESVTWRATTYVPGVVKTCLGVSVLAWPGLKVVPL